MYKCVWNTLNNSLQSLDIKGCAKVDGAQKMHDSTQFPGKKFLPSDFNGQH